MQKTIGQMNKNAAGSGELLHVKQVCSCTTEQAAGHGTGNVSSNRALVICIGSAAMTSPASDVYNRTSRKPRSSRMRR